MSVNAADRASRVSVAVPTYRREGELLRCLETVLALDPRPLEVLIVDQTEEHEPATNARLEELDRAGRIRWIHHSPPSLPGARNRALAEARGELVLFLDDEVEVPVPLVVLHARHFEDPTISVTGGRVVEPGFEPPPYPFFVKITRSGRKLVNFAYAKAGFVVGAPGGNHMVRRQVALDVGGYEERLSRAARGEDMEFCQRVLARGGRIFFDPEAELVHRPAPRGGTRTQGGFEDYFRDYYHDDAFFFLRHVGVVWLPLYFARHVVSTLNAALGRREREYPGVPRGLTTWPRLLLCFLRGFGRAVRSVRRPVASMTR